MCCCTGLGLIKIRAVRLAGMNIPTVIKYKLLRLKNRWEFGAYYNNIILPIKTRNAQCISPKVSEKRKWFFAITPGIHLETL